MTKNENTEPENRMTRQVYYTDVRMSTEVLGNEWDKRLFLTALEEASGLPKYEM